MITKQYILLYLLLPYIEFYHINSGLFKLFEYLCKLRFPHFAHKTSALGHIWEWLDRLYLGILRRALILYFIVTFLYVWILISSIDIYGLINHDDWFLPFFELLLNNKCSKQFWNVHKNAIIGLLMKCQYV